MLLRYLIIAENKIKKSNVLIFRFVNNYPSRSLTPALTAITIARRIVLLNDLVIRAICFFLKKDISDLTPSIPIVQNIDFIIFSAVKHAILLPTLLYRRFAGIFGYLLQFSTFCFTWNNTYLGQILLYRS